MKNAVLSVVLSIVASVFAVTAINAFAEGGGGQDQPAAGRATLGTAFTYQGRLHTAGSPAEGSHTMRFTLHSDSTVASPVGSPIELVVDVAAGLFATELDFGPGVFDGEARWLQVEVHNGTSFEGLTPRQPQTAVPYALFALSGGTQYTAGAGLALTGTQFSVQFLSAGPVNGSATSAARSDHTHFAQAWSGSTTSAGLNVTNSGTGVGVQGEAPGWIGVLGKSTAWTGVRGESTEGDGVVGESVNDRGVVGRSINDYGIIGVTSHEHSAGVLGVAEDNGMGVIGVAQPDTTLPFDLQRGIAIVGRSYPVGGNPIYGDRYAAGAAVYGESSAGAGVAGYSSYTQLFYDPRNLPAGVRAYGKTTGLHAEGGVDAAGTQIGFGNGIIASGGNTVNSSAIYAPQGLLGYSARLGGDVLIEYGTFTNNSDARLKHDIVVSVRGLNEVMDLRPVSYAWNGDPANKPHLGLVAQDVREVLPEIVHEVPDTGNLSVAYLEIIPVLINAIQEQQAQIEALGGGQATGAQVTGAVTEVGPSNAALYSVAGAVTLFAFGLLAMAGAMFRTRRA